jgi:hypothetical protein
MAQTQKYCRDHDYEHWFWTITERGEIALKIGTQYKIIDLAASGVDLRIFKMLADPKIHYVMRGDILRFVIIYEYGGFYADADTVVMDLQDSFLKMDYVCGYEQERAGAGRPGLEQKPICTGFFGAPSNSPVNEAMIENILDGYDAMRSTGKYPKDMWDVIALTVDPLVKICERFGIKPFEKEYFFPYPLPEAQAPFTIHYYAGTEPGGWTFDHCKNEDCPSCRVQSSCKISRAGRR